MKITFPNWFFNFKNKKRQKKPVSCELCLIVHDTVLLHAQHQNFIAQADDSLLKLTATELAEAARRLLPHTTQQHRVALALPSSEFVATSLKLPAAAAAPNPKKVVNLQKSRLLPGVTEKQLIAVQVPADGEQTCALWLPEERAEELFQAFDKVGLFLSCILPRPLVVLPHSKKPYQVYDEDERTLTYLEWSDRVIRRWLHVPKMDCGEPEFKTQLDEALSNFATDIEPERKTSVSDWEKQPLPSQSAYRYAFVPPSAEKRMAQAARQKKHNYMKTVGGVVIVLVIGLISFATWNKQRLEQRLAELKRTTDTISQLRAEVGEIDELIGPVKNFPRQEVIVILEKLNEQIPKTSWITNFELEWGIVKFEGYSPNPSQLIEILSQEPHISNVELTRATASERGKEELKFGISFKLKGLDWLTYQSEYFSER